MRYLAFIGLSSILMAACVRERPLLYPNELVRAAGAAAAEREIDDCMQRAEDFVGKARRGEVVFEETITGSRGLSGGMALDSNFKQDPMPTYRTFVNRCLRQKGYEPLEWK